MRIEPHGTAHQPLQMPGVVRSGQVMSFSPVLSAHAQSPLDALSALDQWRAHAEDIEKHSARWSLTQGPLKVFIEPHPEDASEALPYARPEALMGAFRQWEAALQGVMGFVLLAAPTHGAEDADVVITWEAHTTLGREYEVGHTNRTVQGKRITGAQITLITQPLIDGQLNASQRQQRLYTTVLHEAGHALGLEHSTSAKDVMYYRGWQHPCLSENDKQRMRHLYGWTE